MLWARGLLEVVPSLRSIKTSVVFGTGRKRASVCHVNLSMVGSVSYLTVRHDHEGEKSRSSFRQILFAAIVKLKASFPCHSNDRQQIRLFVLLDFQQARETNRAKGSLSLVSGVWDPSPKPTTAHNKAQTTLALTRTIPPGPHNICAVSQSPQIRMHVKAMPQTGQDPSQIVQC